VVCPDIRGRGPSEDPEARLEEAKGLAQAIGIEVAEAFVLPVRTVRPGTLFGEGQIERIATECEQEQAELVIVDGSLSAIQQRNLEEKLKRKVIDRTGLILEIFGERAATAEGRLQVELAHLDYQQSRLVRSWTHLERQRGGFGFLGGPGETQIEAARRMIRARMGKLRRELEQVKKTRGLHRERRGRAPWPVIALVGYTNAGKSTLFNRMTGAEVIAEDMLFATLDPAMRAVRLPGLDKAILSDTVGFISDLPTQLVAAFRATLEEVTAADLIVHVRDMANPDNAMQKRQVLDVLGELGVVDDAEEANRIPILEAWNKLDLLDPRQRQELADAAAGNPEIVMLSAQTGEGVGQLEDSVAAVLTAKHRHYRVVLPLGDGAGAAWLHQNGEVVAHGVEGDEAWYDVRMAPSDYERFQAQRERA
jgi:GTPase